MSKAIDRYLYTVSILHEQYYCVRSVDVAHFLDVSKVSVSTFVRQAKDRGLLEMEADGNLRLTLKGKEHAARLDSRIRFFRQVLLNAGVKPAIALRDSISFSWEMSDESYEAFQSAYSPPRTPDIGSERVQSHSFSP